MKSLILSLILLVSSAAFAQKDIMKDWQKMHDSKADALVEFNEAKFGMFIHWGVYSVPAGKWDGQEVKGIGEWIMYRANIPREDYKALSSQFNPTGFDAEEWVQIAKDAGMKYIVCMPKHHDGFAMYHSEVSDYNIYDATPFKRDPIDELYQACKKYNIKFGFYYSHATDWMDGGDAGVADFLQEIEDGKRDKSEFSMKGGRQLWPANDWDPVNISFQEYLDNKALPQVKELMEKYSDVSEIWFDMERNITPEQSFEFYKMVYEYQPNAVINSRIGNEMGDLWIPGDNKIPESKDANTKMYWETPGTLNNTWGYKSYDIKWKTADELIYWITEIASKGGNYLLNVGPDEKGVIPSESVTILREIGTWMRLYGEAIYGTNKWSIPKEGPTNIAMKGTREREKMKGGFTFTNEDFWFTQKDNVLYAICLTDLEENKMTDVLVKSINPQQLKISNIQMIGNNREIKWDATADQLKLELAPFAKSPLGYVLKITLEK